jgi:hypothetical protein
LGLGSGWEYLHVIRHVVICLIIVPILKRNAVIRVIVDHRIAHDPAIATGDIIHDGVVLVVVPTTAINEHVTLAHIGAMAGAGDLTAGRNGA